MVNKTFLFLFTYIFFSFHIITAGTTGKIAGRITGTKGEGLQGANVFLKTTSIGVATDEDGYYALTKTHHEVIRQNLKNLILTVPGERIMIPDFGVGLKKLLFEQRDPDIYASICASIYALNNKIQLYLLYMLAFMSA